MNVEKILVVGHKNPDTDSICSAIVYASLKTKLGVEAEPVRLGVINGETQFALEYFHVNAPRLVQSVSDEAHKVILVDHNERQQSADDIQSVTVVEVVDHHRIANFETAGPLYYRAEPVGCTATILNKLFKEHGLSPDATEAGLMISAIVSDTLLMKSPTCTEEDVAALKELTEIAKIDLEEYGLNMLKAGADLSGKPISELISLDSKEFQMGPYKVEIAQVNTVDTQDVLGRQAELEERMKERIADKQLDLFLYIVTDILQNDSIGVALGEQAEAVEVAYGISLESNRALLKGVVSRKQQVVPVLTDVLNQRHKN